MKNPVAKFMNYFNKPNTEKDSRHSLLSNIAESEMYEDSLKPATLQKKVWKVGDRVKGNEKCGFNRAMRGTVVYVEPNMETVWVRRDGADSDCFFYEYELDAEQ